MSLIRNEESSYFIINNLDLEMEDRYKNNNFTLSRNVMDQLEKEYEAGAYKYIVKGKIELKLTN